MTAVLRQAVAADTPAIWAVRFAVTENTLAPGRITDEDVRREIEETGRGWVVEEDGRIVAFAIGNAVTGNVWALFVHPEAQGRGHGRRLHETMVDWLRSRNAPTLWLTTGVKTRARHFYENRGWKRVSLDSQGEARYELPASAMTLQAIGESGATLARLGDAAEVVQEVVKATVDLYGRRGFVPPFIGYLAEEGGRCVGGCGFAGPPANGEAEIAYFTFPGNEGRGVATRMAKALVALARADAVSGGIRFIAHTLPQEGPSATVLRRLGFVLLGPVEHPEDGTVWKWREAGP